MDEPPAAADPAADALANPDGIPGIADARRIARADTRRQRHARAPHVSAVANSEANPFAGQTVSRVSCFQSGETCLNA